MKYVRMLILSLVVLGLVGIPSATYAQDGGQLYLPSILGSSTFAEAAAPKPMPPHSDAFGKSLSEWQYAYWDWLFPSSDLDGLQAGTNIGKVYLMPILGPYPNTDPKEVVVSPGTAFMLPMYMWFGERYPDGSIDASIGVDDIADAKLLLTLDGNTLICGNRADCIYETDLSHFFTGGDFDSPYIAPLFGGATFVWFEGLGILLPPLSVGEHELRLIVEDYIDALPGVPVEYDNTWNITVSAK